MKSLHTRLLAIMGAMVLGAGTALAQTGAPTSPIAPGPDIPTFGLGAVGPGNVPIAPGAASSGDLEIERIAPGGARLAPGPAGSVSGSVPLSTPVAPAAPSFGGMRVR
jgi:hypothetical protein